MCLATPNPAINEVKNTSKTGDAKGRFLSLPVPNKCANRKLSNELISENIPVHAIQILSVVNQLETKLIGWYLIPQQIKSLMLNHYSSFRSNS